MVFNVPNFVVTKNKTMTIKTLLWTAGAVIVGLAVYNYVLDPMIAKALGK